MVAEPPPGRHSSLLRAGSPVTRKMFLPVCIVGTASIVSWPVHASHGGVTVCHSPSSVRSSGAIGSVSAFLMAGYRTLRVFSISSSRVCEAKAPGYSATRWTDRAGTRIGAGRSDFAQEIDLGRRELFENEPFEFGMGDGRHEAAANEGDCLSVEGFEPRRLNDRLNGARRERHEYGRLCCLAVLFGKGTDPVCAFRGCRAGYREQEKSDRKRQCSLDCQQRGSFER